MYEGKVTWEWSGIRDPPVPGLESTSKDIGSSIVLRTVSCLPVIYKLHDVLFTGRFPFRKKETSEN